MTDHNAIILSIIKSYQGDANKRTQAEITDECIAMGGVNITERQTRIILRELIDNGAPIISTPAGGYYWYDTEEERTSCYKRLRHKGISILVRARRMNRNCLVEKARRREWEQLSLLEVG
ncbi:MAG: hypothetical protein KAW56_03555 [Candidatus Marinimicrobia bacterium]|nr:hypothetical protein [Candidatus Neomarinimicrobiota bacterium]